MNIDESAENMGIDREFYLELVGDFFEKARDDLKKIDAAIETGNTDSAFAAAHSVKGAAGSLNFVEIAELAEDIEKMAVGGRMNELEESAGLMKSKIGALNALFNDAE